jgi:hypothetical protein
MTPMTEAEAEVALIRRMYTFMSPDEIIFFTASLVFDTEIVPAFARGELVRFQKDATGKMHCRLG